MGLCGWAVSLGLCGRGCVLWLCADATPQSSADAQLVACPAPIHHSPCTPLPHFLTVQALREAILDEAEGADIMMVKPGLPYLDVIRLLRDNTPLPIAAYHVSGGWVGGWVGRWQGWLGGLRERLGRRWRGLGAGREPVQNTCAAAVTRWPQTPSLFQIERNHLPTAAPGSPCPPVAAAGEYAMLKAAAERGWLNEKDAVLEALMCLKRAGSDLILTYYATEAAKWMAADKPSWR